MPDSAPIRPATIVAGGARRTAAVQRVFGTRARPTSGSALEGVAAERRTIGCVVPACNEEASIAQVIESLLSQTRVPDVIHVVVSDTTDATVEIASRYAGPHEVETASGTQFTEVFVHDMGTYSAAKARALTYGGTLVDGYDHLIGIDGSTAAEATEVERFERRAVDSLPWPPRGAAASRIMVGVRSIHPGSPGHERGFGGVAVSVLAFAASAGLLAGAMSWQVCKLVRHRHGSKV